MAQFDYENQTRQLEAIGLMCKTVSLNPGSIGAAGVGTATAAVSGLTPAHRCFVAGAGVPSGAVGIFGARCVTPGTLTVDFFNGSAGAIDLSAVNCTLFAIPGDLN